MKKIQILLAIVILVAIVVVMISVSACGSNDTPPNPSPTTVQSSEIKKPVPEILSVNATTAGILDNYYVTLDITAKNAGADGVIIVIGSITQNGATQRNEMPIYLEGGAAQTVKLVFPIKWKGGDWTPTVDTQIP